MFGIPLVLLVSTLILFFAYIQLGTAFKGAPYKSYQTIGKNIGISSTKLKTLRAKNCLRPITSTDVMYRKYMLERDTHTANMNIKQSVQTNTEL